MATLVVAEHDNVKIKSVTLNTVTAALQFGADVHILVAGQDASDAAIHASRIRGVLKVLLADGEPHAHFSSHEADARRRRRSSANSDGVFGAFAGGGALAASAPDLALARAY